MSANLYGYDADQHAPMDNYEAVPDGEYRCIAIDSEMKPTKSGGGEYLQITWECIDGEYRGRKFWSRLNLKNANQTAVDLAQRELSSICRAVGVLKPRDSAEFHGKPVILKIGHETRKDTGDIQNRIKGYSAIGSQSQPAAPAPTAPQPPPAAAPPSGTKPPWRS